MTVSLGEDEAEQAGPRPAQDAGKLDGLISEVHACRACPLGLTRTNAVPGEGPSSPEVMCIGEAPGQNEDKHGRPFIGAAGKFLDECLETAGQKREDVYICNVLKCRPPSNRDPQAEEIAACSSFLERQIQLLNPFVIITLGRFSMGHFFPGRTISRIHGRWKEQDGRFFVPMYHPAAALHQGSLRATILEDFSRLPGIIERAKQQRLATAEDRQLNDDDQDPPTQISLFE